MARMAGRALLFIYFIVLFPLCSQTCSLLFSDASVVDISSVVAFTLAEATTYIPRSAFYRCARQRAFCNGRVSNLLSFTCHHADDESEAKKIEGVHGGLMIFNTQ
uniref:Secreted protein n=1 Tax=Amblyomma americanum TaxID=6943 RepID=A0A0C9S3I5_AMBAM